MRYQIESTFSMMGSEVDLAVESILSKECTTDVGVEVAGASLMSDFSTSLIYHSSASMPPEKNQSPSCSSSDNAMIGSPTTSESSLLSTPITVVDNSCYPAAQDHQQNDFDNKDVSDADVINSLGQDFIDEAILEVVFDVHRWAKFGLMFLFNKSAKNEEKFRIVDEFQMLNSHTTDIFGQSLSGASSKSKFIQQVDCLCPECNQSTAACRFAPHLEKCMGMGRNSFRKARTRLAASSNTNAASSSGHFSLKSSASSASVCRTATATSVAKTWSDVDDDDDDDDWMNSRKKGQKKRLVLKGNKKKLKNTPLKKQQSSSSLVSSQSHLLSSQMLEDSPTSSAFLNDMIDGSSTLYSSRTREGSTFRFTDLSQKSSSSGNQEILIDTNVGGGEDYLDCFDVPSPSL